MKFSRYLLAIVLMVVLYQCGDKPQTDKDLLGKKEDDITKLYGNDYSTKFLVVSDSLKEYEYGLIIMFPMYKKDTIRVKELIWLKGKEKSVFWLVKKDSNWIVVDNVSWNVDKVQL